VTSRSSVLRSPRPEQEALAQVRREILSSNDAQLADWKRVVQSIESAMPNMNEDALLHYQKVNRHLRRWIRQREERVA